jgi:hypothetical protein
MINDKTWGDNAQLLEKDTKHQMDNGGDFVIYHLPIAS